MEKLPNYFNYRKICSFITPERRQSITLLTLTNTDQKSLETMILIAICRQSGEKWQSKTMLLPTFGLRSSIVLTFSISPIRFGFVACFMMLRWTFYLELSVLEREVCNNDDITLFSVY